jgi:hypothetical protein
LPYRQLIMFGYRAGPVVTAGVVFDACSQGILTVGGRPAVFGSPLQDALFFYTSFERSGQGPVMPDVTGLSAQDAAAAATRHGFSLFVAGAAFDDAMPSGAVAFQSPPPGVAATGPGLQLEVILAVPHAPACAASQLAVSYHAGGFATGNDFGAIIFRDIGAAPCRLVGLVRVTGLDAAGRAVTNTVASRFADPGMLSPHAPPIPATAGLPPGELVYRGILTAEYRDSPSTGGLCNPRWVIPASWRIVFSGEATFLVRNADPHFGGPSRSGGLITCQGSLRAAPQWSYLTS